MDRETQVFDLEDYNNIISHSGVEGMEKGDRNGPPYPLSESIRRMLSQRAQAKQKEKEQKKIKYTSEILKRGNLKEIYKYRKYFTDEQLQQVINRVTKEDKIAEIISKREAGRKSIAKTLKNLAQSGIKNAGGAFYKSLTEEYGKKMARDIIGKD